MNVRFQVLGANYGELTAKVAEVMSGFGVESGYTYLMTARPIRDEASASEVDGIVMWEGDVDVEVKD